MTGHEPFPHQHDAYPWPETPSETALRDELREAASSWGDVRSFEGMTLPLADTALRDILPDIPADATHVRMQGYERFDHYIYAQELPDAGLTVTLRERQRYQTSETAEGGVDPVEPIRLSIE